MPDPDKVARSLRDLVLRDPRQARAAFVQHFEGDPSSTDQLLRDLSQPGYARVRSLVANVARNHPDKRRLVAALRHWYESETDEFTRRAINAALKNEEVVAHASGRSAAHPLPTKTVELYRYVADRLRHRLRNSVLAIHSELAELKDCLGPVPPEAVTALARLENSLLTIERSVEAIDADPEYFSLRPVRIAEWLKQMNARYAAQYPAVRLSVEQSGGLAAKILASNYLLENIFWNLWLNAHQAIGAECEISAIITQRHRTIELAIADNGPGFPDELQELAFLHQYSTSTSIGRGRGLLEAADAAERLGGTITLFSDRQGDLRIKITFPEFSR